MTFTVHRLDAPFGAEIRELDLATPLAAAERDRIVATIDDHLLLVIRNADRIPTNAQVAAFCEAIGPLRPTMADQSRLPDHPGINRVSNRNADGVVGTGGSGLVTWHSDLSFLPPLIEFVYLDALLVPPQGGDTKFANCRAAYDALPGTLRAQVDDLGVRYRLRDGIDFSGYFKTSDPESLRLETVVSLVHTNARTGAKSIWPNYGPDFDIDVLGMTHEAGMTLLRELMAQCTREEFVYRHVWQRGDAVLWLNTQVMHEREAFDDRYERALRHVNILGAPDPRQLMSGS